jgi:hypothetical protein
MLHSSSCAHSCVVARRHVVGANAFIFLIRPHTSSFLIATSPTSPHHLIAQMMEDAMDGIMDDEESEEDTERIVAGVFDELNIQARARGSDADTIIGSEQYRVSHISVHLHHASSTN